MPIKPGNFGTSSSDPEPAAKAAPEPAPKAKRRGKKQMIADAVIPDAGTATKIKDKTTGETIERPWEEAVAMFREGKADFVDPPDAPSPLKYAVMKMDEQGEAGAKEKDVESLEALEARWTSLQEQIDECKASDTEKIEALNEEAEFVRGKIGELSGSHVALELGRDDPASDKRTDGRTAGVEGQNFDEEFAVVGDQVVINGDTFYVGHGKKLTSGRPHYPEGDARVGQPMDILGKWQGGKRASLIIDQPVEIVSGSSGSGISVQPSKPRLVQQSADEVSPGVWRVTMGYLEKIGLPEYSSLAIGPCTATHEVVDSGERIEVEMGDRKILLPKSVVDAMQECAHVCEYVMRSERAAMINFLEAVKPGSGAQG